jgi:hypothetical protein
MSDQTKAVVECWNCGWIHLIYFFIDYCENNFNFFFLISFLGKFARNVTWTSGLLQEFSCVIAVLQLLPGTSLRSLSSSISSQLVVVNHITSLPVTLILS